MHDDNGATLCTTAAFADAPPAPRARARCGAAAVNAGRRDDAPGRRTPARVSAHLHGSNRNALAVLQKRTWISRDHVGERHSGATLRAEHDVTNEPHGRNTAAPGRAGENGTARARIERKVASTPPHALEGAARGASTERAPSARARDRRARPAKEDDRLGARLKLSQAAVKIGERCCGARSPDGPCFL